jgi:hypothetical protein
VAVTLGTLVPSHRAIFVRFLGGLHPVAVVLAAASVGRPSFHGLMVRGGLFRVRREQRAA